MDVKIDTDPEDLPFFESGKWRRPTLAAIFKSHLPHTGVDWERRKVVYGQLREAIRAESFEASSRRKLKSDRGFSR